MEGDVWSPSIKLLSPTRRVSRRQIKFLGLAQGISPWARHIGTLTRNHGGPSIPNL